MNTNKTFKLLALLAVVAISFGELDAKRRRGGKSRTKKLTKQQIQVEGKKEVKLDKYIEKLQDCGRATTSGGDEKYRERLFKFFGALKENVTRNNLKILEDRINEGVNAAVKKGAPDDIKGPSDSKKNRIYTKKKNDGEMTLVVFANKLFSLIKDFDLDYAKKQAGKIFARIIEEQADNVPGKLQPAQLYIDFLDNMRDYVIKKIDFKLRSHKSLTDPMQLFFREAQKKETKKRKQLSPSLETIIQSIADDTGFGKHGLKYPVEVEED